MALTNSSNMPSLTSAALTGAASPDSLVASQSMAIVLERINRSGQVSAIQSFNQPTVNVGRAYDQDYIVDDAYVDALHARLVVSADDMTLTCIDLGSVNGIRIEPRLGKPFRVMGTAQLHSGDTIMIGRTRLRVMQGFQPVPPARAMTARHQGVRWLNQWRLALSLLAVLVMLFALDNYLDMPLQKHLARYVTESVYVAIACLIYAGFWSLINRSSRGDARFALHVVVACGGLLVLLIGHWALLWLRYHFASAVFWSFAQPVIVAAYLFAAAYVSVRLATRMGKVGVALLASILPLLMLASVLLKYYEKPRLHDVNYQRELVSPVINLRPSISSHDFVAKQARYYAKGDSSQSEPLQNERPQKEMLQSE